MRHKYIIYTGQNPDKNFLPSRRHNFQHKLLSSLYFTLPFTHLDHFAIVAFIAPSPSYHQYHTAAATTLTVCLCLLRYFALHLEPVTFLRNLFCSRPVSNVTVCLSPPLLVSHSKPTSRSYSNCDSRLLSRRF